MSEHIQPSTTLTHNKEAMLDLLLANDDEIELFDCSFAQERLWFFDQFQPQSPVYNMPAAVAFRGNLNLSAFTRAVNTILARHEALRTNFTVEDGVALQIIRDFEPIQLDIDDLSNTPSAESLEALMRRINNEAQRGFDLSHEPLLRVKVLRLATDHHILFVNMHHIVSDGWSIGIFINELVISYKAYCQNQEPELPELSVQYADYALWQRENLELFDEQLEFWKQSLSGIPDLLQLPTDRPRPDTQTFNGAHCCFTLDQDLCRRIKAMAHEQGITLYMFFLAAFAVLLSRHSAQTDFCIGSPNAGRNRVELEHLIGFFVNVLILRIDLSANPSVIEFINRVKRCALAAFAHQDTPFELLVEKLSPKRSISYAPIAQIGFAWQNTPQETIDLPDLSMEYLELETGQSKYDLTLVMEEQANAITAVFEYNTDLFNGTTITRLADHFRHIINVFLNQPEQPVSVIELVPAEQRLALLSLSANKYERVLPLTAPQRDLYLDALRHPQNRFSSTGYRLEIECALNPTYWQQAINVLHQHHLALRCRFENCNIPYAEFAYQCVRRQQNITCTWLDISNETITNETITNETIDKTVTDFIFRQYDLDTDELIHHLVIRHNDQRFTAVLAVHHVLLDGIGGTNYLKQLLTCYQALSCKQPIDLPEDHFIDSIPTQRNTYDRMETLSFWHHFLSKVKPLDAPMPIACAAGRKHHKVRIDNSQWLQLKQCCRNLGITPTIYFRGLYGYLLWLYCRANEEDDDADFIIFEILSGRQKLHLNALGCYYQQAPVRFSTSLFTLSSRIEDYFKEIKGYHRKIKEYVKLSVFQQQKLITTARLRFFFNVYSFADDLTLFDQPVSVDHFIPFPDDQVQFVVRLGQQFAELNIHFDAHFFDDFGLLDRLLSISDQIIAGANTFADLNPLLPHEQQQHFCNFNQTNHYLITPTPIIRQIEQQAAKTPEHIALIYAQEHLTYRQLNQRANQLAHWLQSQDITTGKCVGICVERSSDWIIAVLAILKTGATYVPLDPSYPDTRLMYMLEDANIKLLLTWEKLEKPWLQARCPIFYLDRDTAILTQQPGENLNCALSLNDLAYIIYTSGSTGQPKGAMVNHSGIVNLIDWYRRTFEFSSRDRTLLVSAIGFDLTQKNVFAPLSTGGCLVIPVMAHFDIDVLLATCREHEITLLNCAPSVFCAMVGDQHLPDLQCLESLRYVLLGGEPIELNQLSRWLAFPGNHAHIVNTYGPTECTDIAAFYIVEDALQHINATIPLGQPIDNVQLYVLNAQLNPVPPGVPGELFIAGKSVGRGYVNDPTKTAATFIRVKETHLPSLLPTIPIDTILYRTGDLVRFRADGLLEYLGRKDNQVKLHGLRIELGEIEQALKSLPEIQMAVVLVVHEQLIGYVVVTATFNESQVKTILHKQLPDYMVPAKFITVTEIPLTANGKIDRKALPQPEHAAGIKKRSIVAPRTLTEEILCKQWLRMLKLNEISVEDDFFEIGGHSLLATQVISKIREYFQIDLQLKTLFEKSNIAEIAAIIDQTVVNPMTSELPAITPIARTDALPTTFSQERLWFLEQLDPGNILYNIPAAVQLYGPLDCSALQAALDLIVKRHETLRSCFYSQDGKVLVRIKDTLTFPLTRVAMHQQSLTNAMQQATAWLQKEVQKPFNLETGPLITGALLELNDDRHILFINTHHIVSDGWSAKLMIEELGIAYPALQNLQKPQLPHLPVQVVDYAHWQRHYVAGDIVTTQLTFWHEYLADCPVLLNLPTDRPRPNMQTFFGASHEFSITDKLLKQIQGFNQRHHTTLFMTLLATYQILLARYSKQTDICVGIPSAGRERAEIENLIGFFVNALVIRCHLQDNPDVASYMKTIRDNVLTVFAHQDVPAEQVIESVAPPRSLSHAPIAQVGFSLLNFALPAMRLADLIVEPMPLASTVSKYDMTFNLIEENGLLNGVVEYNTDLFDATTITTMTRHYIHLLNELTADDQQNLDALEMLDTCELMQLLGVDAVKVEDVLPCTPTQRDLYMHSILQPDTIQNSLGYAIDIYQALNVDLLVQAFAEVVAQQPVLRTEIVASSAAFTDPVYQCVYRHKHVDIEIMDLTQHQSANIDVDEILRELIYSSYNIRDGALIRFFIIKLAANHYLFGGAAHHIMLDGSCAFIHQQQIQRIYAKLLTQQMMAGTTSSTALTNQNTEALQYAAEKLAIAPPIFAEYVHHQQSVWDTKDIQFFWQQRLQAIDSLNLPTPLQKSQELTKESLILTATQSNKIKKMCRTHRMTPSIYFKALYALLLNNYCQPEKPFALIEILGGREKQHRYALGCYYHPLPLVFAPQDLSRDTTVTHFFKQFKMALRELGENKSVSLMMQTRYLPETRIQFLYNFYNFPERVDFLGQEAVLKQFVPLPATQQIQLIIQAVGDHFEGILYYHRDVFAALKFLDRLLAISEQICAGITCLGEIDFLLPDERYRTLTALNQTEQLLHQPSDLIARFSMQVQSTPNNTALIHGDRELSYLQLEQQSNQLAHYLLALGVAPNICVGICLRPSLTMMIAVFAVIKAGGAYVPLDPEYPAKRLAYMVQLTHATVILCTETISLQLPDCDSKIICLDHNDHATTHYSDTPPVVTLDASRLAYVIFTSGSTGMPKAAGVYHSGFANLLNWYLRECAINSDDASLIISSFSFDLTQKNLFAVLLTGGRLIFPEQSGFDVEIILATLQQHTPTLLNCAPSAFLPLLNEPLRLASLRYLILGGEPIQWAALADWLTSPQCETQLLNTYGPTECTDIATCFRVAADADNAIIPIGRPIANVRVYLLNNYQTPQPEGVPGEICIAGMGVGAGYLQDSEKTAQAFVTVKLGSELTETVYRTGDIARLWPSGDIEYLGRRDQQVKIRGLRIELGEIERSLSHLSDIVEAAVAVHNQAVVAYVVATADTFDQEHVIQRLASVLPHYMLPTLFIPLAQLPRSPNGKLDRNALPAPDLAINGKTYIAPCTQTEKILCELWQALLGQSQIGINDDFFASGGHSLLATQLISRIREQFKVELPLRSLFEATTVEKLAKLIDTAKQEQSALPLPAITPKPLDVVAPLSFSQERLWFLDKLEPDSPLYNMPVAVRVVGSLDVAALQAGINALITRHEVLRTNFISEGGQPELVIHASVHCPIKLLDCCHLDPSQRLHNALQLAKQEALKPFDLATDVLLRVVLAQFADSEHILLCNMHHIISDGWSAGIIVQELGILYSACLEHREAGLPTLAIQYSDYAYWQRTHLQGDILAAQLKYWTSELENVPDVISLPTDYPRPAVQTYKGAHYQFQLSTSLTEALLTLSRREGVTLFMSLIAVYQSLLSRYCGQEQFCVGIPIAGRHRYEAEPLIGFFVNSLIMRADLSRRPTFTELLKSVKATTLAAFANQDLPVERLVDTLVTERHINIPPLAQVGFALQNIPAVEASLPGLTFSLLEPEYHTAKLDLLLMLSESADGLTGIWEYNTDLFKHATIEHFTQHFMRMLEAVCHNPQIQLSLFDFVEEQELHVLLKLTPAVVQEIWPLATVQRDLYLDARLNPTATFSSVGMTVHFDEAIDPVIWQRALRFVVDNEPLLSAILKASDCSYLEPVYWCTRKQHEIAFEWLDLRLQKHTGTTPAQLVKERCQRTYDILHDDLISHSLIRCADNTTLAIIAAHHILLDGIGVTQFFDRVCKAYVAFSKTTTYALPEANYRQFIEHNRNTYDTSEILDYWRQQADRIEPLDFPTPTVNDNSYCQRSHHIMGEQFKALKQFCRRQKLTPTLFVKGLYGLLLKTYCRAEQPFVVYEVLAGRNRAYRETIGCCYQQVPLVFDPIHMQTTAKAADYLEIVRTYYRNLVDAQFISVMAQNRLLPQSRLQFFFNARPFMSDITSDGLSGKLAFNIQYPQNQVQLIVDLASNQSMLLNLHYHSAYFNGDALLSQLMHLVTQWMELASTPGDFLITQLQWLTAKQQQELLDQHRFVAPIPTKETIIHCIETVVATTPEAIALIQGEIRLTYAQLNQLSNQWANFMLSTGVKPGSLIGIYCHRSIDLVVAILATLKTGSAYLPMDPAYPKLCIHHMIEDAKLDRLLTQSCNKAVIEDRGLTVDCIDTAAAFASSTENPAIAITPQDRIYVIYTSGSTGKPKGAGVRHGGFCNLLKWYTQEFKMSATDKNLIISAVGFDLTQKNLMALLTVGGAIVFPNTHLHDPRAFIDAIHTAQISQMNCAPSALYSVLDYIVESTAQNATPDYSALRSLEKLFLGGEAINISRLLPWLESQTSSTNEHCCEIINTYGPTECTDVVAFFRIDNYRHYIDRPVPLGKSIQNVQLLIVDHDLRLVPPGVTGELMIAGCAVGAGYLYREVLTNEKFIPNPYCNHPVQNKMYRTGDLVRQLADGQLEYLGRIDNQVKLHGLRIELGEIETRLTQIDCVQAVLVLVLDDQLIGFVVADGDWNWQTNKATLSAVLPAYMVPDIVYQLADMPLTANGKISRQALVRWHTEHVSPAKREIIAPRDQLESQLLVIWQDLLKHDAISIYDVFFEVGGHSLLMVRLMARVQQQCQCTLSLAILMQHNTIAAQAVQIRQLAMGDNTTCLLPMQPYGEQQALFCVHAIDGHALVFQELASALAPNIPFYALQAFGLAGTPHTTVEQMAAHYIKLIQDQQPQGPYQLAGYSFGGLVAFEMARQLIARGETVNHLILFEAPAPEFIAQQQSTAAKSQHIEEIATMVQTKLGVDIRGLLAKDDFQSPETQFNIIIELLEHSGQGLDQAWLQQVFKVYQANVGAMLSYRPVQKIAVTTSLFCEHRATADNALGWNHCIEGEVVIQQIYGGHFALFEKAHLPQWLESLKGILEKPG